MKNVLTIISFVLVALLTFILIKQRSEIITHKNNLEVITQEVEIWKDKNNVSNAKIGSLESSRINDIIKLESKDEEIQKLQKELKNNRKALKTQGSVTIFRGETKVDTVFVPEVTFDVDSIYPTYKKEFWLANWVNTNIVANKDSISFELKIRNEYSVIVGTESQGLLKKKRPFALVKNFNPYSTLEEVRSYQVKIPKKKRLFIGPFVGYNGQLTYGIGIGYGLIKL